MRAPTDLARALDPRYAFSPPVQWAYLVVAMAATIALDIGALSGRPLPWLLTGAATAVVFVPAIRWCRRMSLAHPSRWTVPAVLAVYAGLSVGRALATLACRVLFPEALAYGSSLASTWQPLQRLLPSVLLMATMLGLTAAATAAQAQHRQARSALVTANHQLLVLAATMEERVETTRQSLLHEVHRQLDPTIERIREQLEASRADPSALGIVDTLENSVDTVVRPLSRRLASQRSPALSDLGPPSDIDAPALTPATVVDASACIWPATIAVLTTIMTLSRGPAVSSPGVVYVASLILGVSTYALLMAIRAILRTRSVKVRAIPFIAVFAVVSATWFALQIAIPLAAGLDMIADGTAWLGVFVRTAIATGVTAYAAVETKRRMTDGALEQVNHELELLISRLRMELWATRRRVSLVLHGRLQSTLISTTMLLAREDAQDVDLSALLQRIEEAAASIDAEAEDATTLDAAMAEIADLWRGQVAVEVRYSPAARARLQSQTALAECAVEIVREAVSNSVRHGGATWVTADAEVVDDRLVILVGDNGTGLPTQPTPGLGSQMLDEVSSDWRRDSSPSGTCLTVVLG